MFNGKNKPQTTGTLSITKRNDYLREVIKCWKFVLSPE